MRHLRGLAIALAVLALSAGVALAGQALPNLATGSPDRANGNEQGQEQAEASQAPEVEASEAPDPSEAPDTAAPAQGTHGALVSQAAQGDTPAGWANHGAYVSAVARGLAQPGDPAPADSGGRVKPNKTPKGQSTSHGQGH